MQPEVSRRYPPIADYAFIGDCHGTALVSRSGSIDWCCMPRMDSESCFGRILDWDSGGYCSLSPRDSYTTARRYLDDTLVLETTWTTDGGRARTLDFFAMRPGGAQRPHRQLIRMVEGLEGEVEFDLDIVVRFDYGELRPWMRHINDDAYAAVGSNDGLFIWSDAGLERMGRHDLTSAFAARPGETVHLSLQFSWPEHLDRDSSHMPVPGPCDERLEETIAWWEAWSKKVTTTDEYRPAAVRSAIVLKTMMYAPTGAIIAAPTTSLPEAPGGERNWDYRFSWVRDSVFTVTALSGLGCEGEADRFRRFIERSAAGSAADLQIMYRIDGSRRMTELILKHLEGYRGARPVRIGNHAAEQVQLDVYGELMELAWLWSERGRHPDADYWRFLSELVDAAATRWMEPDRGLWEVRGEPQHFVHSKVMCWVALDRGIRLAEKLGLEAPLEEWKTARKQIRNSVEENGYDDVRGVYVRAYGGSELDAALLLLPSVGFISYDHERMVRTMQAIRTELDEGGLLVRYRAADGLPGKEGIFLACSFWLVEYLARAGLPDDARAVFERVRSTANDLGLFAEEYDLQHDEMAGNFPQGLTHLAHIRALEALGDVSQPSGSDSEPHG
jgi:GH15 family glucan-1,4-alpha-glucosidase